MMYATDVPGGLMGNKGWKIRMLLYFSKPITKSQLLKTITTKATIKQVAQKTAL